MTDDPKPRATRADKLRDIHAEALESFDRAYAAVYDVRKQCREDRLFCDVAGAPWAGSLGEQFTNRLKFEVNKVSLGVQRIINEYRNNRVSIFFVPKDGAKSKLSDVCSGLLRADESNSTADEAYDNAFEEAVKGGIGAWRLRAEYEDEDDDDNDAQTVRLEPIFDADGCVYFDEDAKRQDKSDARECWVLTSTSKTRYTADWGDSPTSWPSGLPSTEFDWVSGDSIYLAEYYRLEEKKTRYSVYTSLVGEEQKVTDAEAKDEPELVDDLLARGYTLTASKREKTRQVRKYIMSGGRILEDCGVIAGKHIPIVPVYGRRSFIDGVEQCQGHVRNAKDPQRLANMLRSKLGEIAAQSSSEVPIFDPQQMTDPNVRQMWEDQPVANRPYLLAESMRGPDGMPIASGPIGYTKPPQVPPAMAALLQVSEVDLQEVLGNQQNAEEIQPNTSGKAVELVQQRLDMQTFIYISNFAKAMKRSAEIWLSMKADTVVEPGRVMKTLAEDGSASSVEMMRPVIGKDGAEEMENDLSQAHMDVTAEVGPSSSTKRSSVVRALTGLLSITRDPETAQVLEASVLQNIEGEGLSSLNEHYRKKMVRMGVTDPTDDDKDWLAAEQQNRPQDPNAEFLLASAMNEKAKTGKAIADTELSKAKAAETLAGIDIKAREHALKAAQAINDDMQRALQPMPGMM